jgi:hypothetical protein
MARGSGRGGCLSPRLSVAVGVSNGERRGELRPWRARHHDGERERWAGSGTMHLGQCTVAFLFSFYFFLVIIKQQ